jgi:predicted amidohydrolase YtcJ
MIRYSAHSQLLNSTALEIDKLADLIVLSDDPFEIPVDALKDVQVDLTVVGGRVVHQGRA